MISIKYDKTEVKQAAAGQWQRICESLGLRFELGKHQPCPKCGGTDRFRPFDDFEQTGGMICGAGGCNVSCPDGFDALAWFHGWEFTEAVSKVAEVIGVKPRGKSKKSPLDRLRLDEQPNEMLIPHFCYHNEGISESGLAAMGARTGNLDDQAIVAFPCWSEFGKPPTNWVVMSATSHKLWHRENQRDVQIRKKTLAKGAGLMGAVDAIQAAETVWKCEGPTDCAALLSVYPGAVAVTNIHGAGDGPEKTLHLLAGKRIVICNDPDEAGQAGAAKWSAALRRAGCAVKNVVLPGGKDLRQFLIDGGVDELRKLVEQATDELPPTGTNQPAREANQPASELEQAAGGTKPPINDTTVDDYAYDRRYVPGDCIDLLTRLMLEVVCQDDEGAVTLYSRATGLVRTVKYTEKLQIPNLLTFGGLPCYHSVTDAPDEEDASKIHIREVRKAIGIAASSKKIAGRVELRGHGIYSTGGDVVVCNGKHLSIFTAAGQWIRTDRPFYNDLVFGFGGESESWYDHDELGSMIEAAKDPVWCGAKIDDLVAIFARWTFQRPIDPQLVAGLVIATFVQQSWKWRPQVSIRGQSNAGKSALFQFLFGDERGQPGLFGRISTKLALSSSAGIRQKIRSTSTIIGVDEFDQLDRPQGILNLLRTAGRGDKLVLGSTHHKHQEFGLINICWLAGIFISLSSEADQNRFIEFELLKPEEPKKSAFRHPSAADVARLSLPLIAIAISIASRASEVAETTFFKCADSIKGINQRIIESLSIPSSAIAVATGQDCETVLRSFCNHVQPDWDVVSDQDDLLLKMLKLTIDIGAGSKISTAEAIGLPDYATHRKQIETQIGIGVRDGDDGNRWLIVHPSSVERKIRDVNKAYSMNDGAIRQLLTRIPGTQTHRARLGGAQQRCVWIPFKYVESYLEDQGDAF
jgi:hypothetical protein